MNVLLTCSGRRNYLVEYFKDTLEDKGCVYTVNSTIDAASMPVADGAFTAPPVYHNEYIEYLYFICQKYDIKLLIPLLDLELPVLARHRESFEQRGTRLAVSKPHVIDICNDKLSTVGFLKKLRLKTPFTTSGIEEALDSIQRLPRPYPLIIKPRRGMGSIAVKIAENKKELLVLFEKVKSDIRNSYLKYYDGYDPETAVIIQEKARGQEYGLDIINDLDGNYITTFIKQKIELRHGETSIALTVEIPELQDTGRLIGETLKHTGILDADLFWDGHEVTVLEMNARFGGGYPFSHLAGANIPAAYIQWAKKKKAHPGNLKIQIGLKGFKVMQMLHADTLKLMEEKYKPVSPA